MAQQQQASLLPSKQGKVELGQRPIPSPQGKQALVKVTAAAVNPVDWKIVDYGIFLTEFPAVLGLDGAGVIESVGPEVTDFKKGDKILFQGRYSPVDEAVFQQYALVDTEIVSKFSDNISDDEAATIPAGSITSLLGLFQQSGIPFPENGPTATGKSVLILGGSSSVGQFGIQLARIAGFSPIITTASAQHTEYLKSLGATHVFDRNVDVKTIQAASPSPISLALDAIAEPSTQSLAYDVLSTPSPPSGAHLAVVLELDPAVKAKNVDGKVSVNKIYGSPHTFKDQAIPLYRNIGKWVKEGKLVPNRVHLVKGGLGAVSEALDVSRKGVSGVKVVLRPQE
ncbi:GroES-like protein [Ceratobasidium sp. AG-I]|nr:GroES-like protein [Ceratobasidium sp. AG-I]